MGNYPLRKRRRQWAGEALGRSTLLVIFEHGLGDMIQLSRFLRPLREAHPRARIIGVVPEPLVGLLARSFPDVDLRIDAADEPACDFYIPSVQLPLALEAASLEPTGRLSASRRPPPSGASRGENAAAPARWGLLARASPPVRTDPLHSPPNIRAIVRCGRTSISSCCSNQLTPDEEVASRRVRQRAASRRSLISSISATLVADCDLVISVDTAVAHVAGAGGKRALLLSRPDSCWRWGHTGTRSGPGIPAWRLCGIRATWIGASCSPKPRASCGRSSGHSPRT